MSSVLKLEKDYNVTVGLLNLRQFANHQVNLKINYEIAY